LYNKDKKEIMMNTERVMKARTFAVAAHAAVGQVRKYTYEPYIVHPAEVFSIVSTVPHTEAMLCAAWLHDVVEDTDVSIDVIRAEFGDDVAELVGWLTDVSNPEDGNRAVRKAIDRAHSAQAPADAQTVKLADLISNSSSITRHDANFAKTYLEEKRMLLEVMNKGDATLMAHARKFIGE
jgi:guanosine-3',5'-bis(diphosphate) 3'-pyrophosphohydrolase